MSVSRVRSLSGSSACRTRSSLSSSVYVSGDQQLSVSVWLGSTALVESLQIPLGAVASSSPFSLSDLGIDPSTDAHDITCVATYGDQEYTDRTQLMYLPENPYNGSSVKVDRVTGYLKVQYEAGQPWETVLPFGFYDVRSSSQQSEWRD